MKNTQASMPQSAPQIRLLLGLVFLTAVFFPALYQPVLDHVWDVLRHTSLYQWSTFETIWTVVCYAAIEVPLTVVFMKRPEWRLLLSPTPNTPHAGNIINNNHNEHHLHSTGKNKTGSVTKPRGMRRPSLRLREAVTYVTPLLAMDLTMIKKFADVPLDAILESGGFTTNNINNNNNNNINNDLLPPKTFLISTLHNFTLSSPLQTSRALPVAAPSARRLATELAASFIIYDTLFFLFHLSLHVVPVLRPWHASHHAHDAQLNPQVTNQLSIPERLGLVLLANFSLNVIGAHVLTRTLFVPAFVWLLVEIHSGLDLPWGYEKVLPAGWGGGAKKHMRHHMFGDGGYEPFFCWWDGLWDRAVELRRGRRLERTG